MTYSSEVLADSPLAYWRFDDTVGPTTLDSSGNSRNGSQANAPSINQTGLLVGDANTCFAFNGVLEYVTVPDGSWMDVTTGFTVEALIRADVIGSTMTIASRDNSGDATNRAWSFRVTAAGKLEYLFFDSGGTLRGPYTAATTLSAATTYHVAVTYNGSTVTIYLNGVSDGTGSHSGSMRNVNQVIQIAARRSGAGNTNDMFDGKIDEPAIYNTALSAARILAHYNAAVGGVQVAASLTGSGAFSALAVPVIAVAASLTGAGVFSASVVEVEQAAANLTGSGAFTAAAFPSHDRTAALTGSGAFSAAVESLTGVSADLEGSGAFTATVVEVEYAAANLTGTGAFSADANPILTVTADLTGTGSFTATRVVVGEEDWSDVDLSTAVFRESAGDPLGTYDDGVILSVDGIGAGDDPRFWFPSLTFGDELDYAETYEFQVTFTDDATWTYLWIEAHPNNSDASFQAGPLELLIDDVGVSGPPPTVYTFTIGPGIYGWSDAATASYVGMTFEIDNQGAISGLRYRIAPESDGEVDAFLTGSGAFTAVAVVAGVEYTDTSNADDGISLDGTAEVFWEPAVVPVPAVFGPLPMQARTVGRVIVTAPTYSPFVPATKADKDTPRLRERVIIGDRDWTFLRDTPIRVDNLRFIDPLLYGSGAITIPQVNPQYDENITLDADGLPYGTGDLAGLERFARVVVQLVDEADVVVVPDYYKGFVSKINADGHSLSVELGGQASGRLSAMYVTPPVYRRKQDVEHILCDTLRDARVRAHEHDGSSGLGLIRRGGSDGLSIFNEVLATWAGATETPITFTPNARGAYRKTVKDTETVDFTAYIDSDLVTQSLSQDFMEQWTRVYANGRTAAGELVSFIRTPGMTQEDPPDFPGLLEVGDTDDSNGYVTAVQQQLTISNYLDYADVDPGVFDEEMAEAVRELQADAGLLVTAIAAGQDGKVNAPTWAALWNLEVIGYSLDDARQYPAAQDSRTSKWNRTANGSKLTENGDYDPHLIPVDGVIDVGGPFGERQIKRFAKSKIAPRGGVWTGTLTLKSGLIRGEHNPGDPFDTADVADRREVMPNHRIWLPRFMGGIVVTVTGADEGADETQLLVSTLPQTTMETWTAIERAREAASNPGNTWSGHVRKSQVRNDVAPEWDTSSGYIANKRALTGDEWTEVKIPAGQSGIVQRIRLQLETPAEFAVLLTQKPVSLGRLNGIQPIEYPSSGRPWYEREANIEWLEDRGVLDAWGTADQPCGYDPSRKSDSPGVPTGEPVTGLFVETAGFNYETGVEPVLFLYVWVGVDNSLLPGRVLRNQRTSGY